MNSLMQLAMISRCNSVMAVCGVHPSLFSRQIVPSVYVIFKRASVQTLVHVMYIDYIVMWRPFPLIHLHLSPPKVLIGFS
jgi:predicted homoserine dehydrogenase-like protein